MKAIRTIANTILICAHLPVSASNRDLHNDAQTKGDKQNTEAYVLNWDYHNRGGAQNWGKLDPRFESCSAGKNQSPISIGQGIDKELDPLVVNYQPGYTKTVLAHHQVRLFPVDDFSITVAGKTYTLKRMVVHTPAEHLVLSRAYPMEIQFEHVNKDGSRALVAVLVSTGPADKQADKVLAALKNKGGHSPKLNLSQWIPSSRDYFFYNGSLTYPPCEEGVLWFVLKSTITMSVEQVHQFKTLTGANARPIQDLHYRFVKQ